MKFLPAERLESFLYLALLAVAGALFVRGMSTFYPLQRYDEARYLFNALAEGGLAHREWSLVYSGFLRYLGAFTGSAIELFYLNAAVQTLLLPVLVFWIALRLGAGNFPAWLAGYLVLISTINAPLFPKVNHFDSSVFLGALLLSSYLRRELASTALLVTLSIFTVFLRPENVLVVLILAGYLAVVARRTGAGPPWLYAVGPVAALALFVYVLGSPFGRSWLSFASYAYARTPTQSFGDFMRDHFGDTTNIAVAALRNPAFFLQHVMANLQTMGTSLPNWLRHFPLTRDRLGDLTFASHVESAILLGVLGLVSRLRGSAISGQPKASAQFIRAAAVTGSALGAKCIFSALIIGVSPRYVLEALLVFLIAAAIAVSRIPALRNPNPLALFAALALAIAVPKHEEGYPYRKELVDKTLFGIRDAVDLLLKLNDGKKMRLCGEVSYRVYSGMQEGCEPSEYFMSAADPAGFVTFLRERKIEVLVVDLATWNNEHIRGAFRESNSPLQRLESAGFGRAGTFEFGTEVFVAR